MERRTFLVLGAAAVGLAGCTSDPTDPGPPSAPAVSSAPRDPDARLRDEVAASEVALISAYRAALRNAPELAADLAPFVAQHQAHLDRVAPGYPASGDADGGSGSGAGSGSGSSSASGSPSDAAEGTSEASASSVLAALADAESAAQAQRAAACDGAQDPALARDLCLIAASEAQHASALATLADQGNTP